MLNAFQKALSRRPLFTQCVSSAVIASAGDALSQLAIEKRSLKKYDIQRTVRFGVLAGFFIAPVLNRWFRTLEKISGSIPNLVPLKRLFVDQSTFSPIFNAVVLFNLRVLEGYNLNDSFSMMTHDWWPVWSTSLLFWPCVQLCNFYMFPLNMRVIVTQLAGLLWNTYLSFKTQKKLPTMEQISTRT